MAMIRVDNLGKRYLIGHDRKASGAFRYQSLRDSLAHQGRALWQRLRHPLSRNRENTELEEFWALNDVSFEIQPGERVGIIGRNGAGKSTLLKLLSRITEPTTGRIELNGRVASLLEVGTGFHPELTGRENIFLNGAVLGMSRTEIKNKFDEIVAFAEVEKFLDTPVKRYSSGMYVRLAFAVAAHLEPEILLVDEVLAVGDVAFQKKCLGKMEDVATNEGRTVLFVSHNMESIRLLCDKAIHVENGMVRSLGGVDKILDNYLLECLEVAHARNLESETSRTGHGGVKATSFRVEGASSSRALACGSPGRLVIGYRAARTDKPIPRLYGALGIKDVTGSNLFVCSTRMFGADFVSAAPEGELSCQLDAVPLMPGQYVVTIKLMDELGLADQIMDAATIQVGLDDQSDLRDVPRSSWGNVCVKNHWSLGGQSHG